MEWRTIDRPVPDSIAVEERYIAISVITAKIIELIMLEPSTLVSGYLFDKKGIENTHPCTYTMCCHNL